MLEEAGSRLGWRTGATRLKMKPQLDLLQSFDAGERAEAGRELVEMGLTRTAHALLDHVVNEFDDRVLAAIASAVRAAPVEDDESRRARELREWAVSELDRLRLEDAFMTSTPRGEAPAVEVEVPAPVPVPAPAAVATTSWTAEPPPSAAASTTTTPVTTRWIAPTTPVTEPARRRSLPYIRWRAPLELTPVASAPTPGAARTRLPQPRSAPVAPPPIAAPPVAAPPVGPPPVAAPTEASPEEVRFEAPPPPVELPVAPPPAPAEPPAPPPEARTDEVRFESPPRPESANSTESSSDRALTLAERLKARR